MSNTAPEQTVLVPVDAITVVNPRIRNQKVFEEITANIAELGLKRPIMVAVREPESGGEPSYELVCGQGRLEAFKALGQSEIPSIVINASSEDCLVMSLVENVARRQHHSLDLLRDIRRLKESGYSEQTQLHRGLSRILFGPAPEPDGSRRSQTALPFGPASPTPPQIPECSLQ
ncbi:ParB N-terminal domain-containing protein [Ruegeria halocynthiae]|uniref:ParB N-terminal domain-containing protein n=1 Tax=Ruegeria halocynthiae TaxID=985054 RepID=UPI0006900E10|nr:ParB N-terminal domain-containing protein [Ruegeria halocynthiae]